jgi:DNA-binding transcriptional LysR family regulator
MDRLDAWTIFAAVGEQGGFAKAARQLGRSPAAVTRAVAALEERLGLRLFNRTTRSVALTDDGIRYLERCRHVLGEVAALEAAASDAGQELQGSLALTAPVIFGRLHVLPIVQRFLADYPAVAARLLLLDRTVSLVEEGLDLGVRIGRLPDSSLRAIQAGAVTRGVYASPDYLRHRGTPKHPRDLRGHDLVAFSATTPVVDRWSFRGTRGSIAIAVRPRLVVNSGEAAIDAAVAGLGLTGVLSYQVTEEIAAGKLRRVLASFEPPPLPIHLVHPAGRHLPARVRLFIDRAAAELRAKFAR